MTTPQRPTGRVVAAGQLDTAVEPGMTAPHESTPHESTPRVVAAGKFLRLDGETFTVRGVTYGSFRPRADGFLVPQTAQVRSDFEQIAQLGLNTARLYAAPPRDLVEAAAESSVRLLVGVHYEDWRYQTTPGRQARQAVLDAGRRALDEAFGTCAGRPEVLAYSVGNEIPADVIRVHGIGAVQDVLAQLVEHVRASDPEALVTYTNFPTTEYLEVEGQTLATFNVFLEQPESLRRYLRRLQVVSGSLPLVITELGLASEIHGEQEQASALAWQLDEIDKAGCAGATVFSFTDEWTVGEVDVPGWGFGITDDERRPKPAASVVSAWTNRKLDDLQEHWPRVTVVVCAYNEQRTIEECLASLAACEYPNLELILCDDGSTDRTLEIAGQFPVRILQLEHGGLSRARNAGIAAATGEIVAFLDADAAADPQWPRRLAMCYEDESVVAAGGPNWPVPGVPFVERAVALAPGNPMEVLVSDDRAEHVPGCNSSFRRSAIMEVGCYDPIYTSAGDDVDVCWKLLDAGGAIGYAPAAQIFHHRRGTVKGFLRQQRGYGRAEKMLWPAHRHRFNKLGQARWAGFIYGGVRLLPSVLKPVIYHGHQGHAPFQGVARQPSTTAIGWMGALLPLSVPVFVVGLLAGLLSPWWFLLAAASVLAVLGYAAAVAVSVRVPRGEPQPVRLRLLVAYLHVAQPFVRVWGNLRAPRRPLLKPVARPWWGDRSVWLRDLERDLRARGLVVRIGGPADDWDLEVRGWLHAVRITVAVLWKWQPVSSTRLRLGRALVVLGAAAILALLLVATGSNLWVVLAAWLLLVVFTGWRVAHSVMTVRRALADSVAGVKETDEV